MKAISLFSGVGGLDLAAEAAGIEPVLFCEIEPYPCAILEKRWPDVPICNDIRTLSGSGFAGTVDVVYGGFPCQDLSCAGKQAGLSGERSGLWFEMLRVVREVRPRWVLAENVRGAINLALDTVQSGLEDEGYVVWPFVIPASAFGAPHRRERLFVVAAREDVADAVTERLEGCEWTGALCEPGPPAHEPVAECSACLWPTPRANDSEKRGDIGDDQQNGLPSAVLWPTPHRNCSNGAGEHGDGGKNIQTAVMWPTPRANKPEGYASDGFSPTLAQRVTGEKRPSYGLLSPDWVENLMGFPIGWTDIDCDEPELWPGWPAGMGAEQFDYERPRTCGKIPNRAKRLKALGNAVVPQQFAAFFEAIREAETCVDTSIILLATDPRCSP